MPYFSWWGDNMQKGQLATVALAVSLIVSVGYALTLNSLNRNLVNRNKQLAFQYKRLADTNRELLTSYHDLNRSYEELTSSYDDLEVNYQTFQDRYASLQSEYDDVIDDYARLEAEYSNLEYEYGNIEADYKYWKNAYEMLNSKYKEVKYDYDVLVAFFDRPLDSKDVPSHLELRSWLLLDQTDRLGGHAEFDCKDFSTVLSVKARTRYWDMGIIAVAGYDEETEERYGHAFNFIVTTEGLVYVEPQRDEYWWYSDHKEIEAGSTWQLGDTFIVVEDVKIILEG
ncbi:MAG: hypothetical protein HWN70_13465 [Desulfobacterales bacterium]|nr:hypothetical protein [Desulfobacterales bacterium]